jgi:hypothetical protein
MPAALSAPPYRRYLSPSHFAPFIACLLLNGAALVDAI